MNKAKFWLKSLSEERDRLATENKALTAEVKQMESILTREGLRSVHTQNKALKAALEEICHIRNNSHKHNAIGKCSDMWKTAATALKETGGQ